MSQLLEDPHNSEDQCFPKGHCLVLQNHTWGKDECIVQDRLMDFNVTEYKMFIDVVWFHFQKIYDGMLI